MLNQVVLVGRLVKEPEVIESENGKKYCQYTLAVPRSFKNADGEYDTDFVNCVSFEGIATNMSEYCKKGDIIGVKGRIQTTSYEKDGEKKYGMEIISEKVNFLAANKDMHHEKDDQER